MTHERPDRRSDKQDLWSDPVVEEVRAIRRRLWEESGRDINEYIRRARATAEQAVKQVRSRGSGEAA